MPTENKPKIRVGIKRVPASEFESEIVRDLFFGHYLDVPIYAYLQDLEVLGKLTESDLEEHACKVVIFERGDVALEGRLYLRNERGEYSPNVRSSNDRYIVEAINGDDIQCPWDKITSGLGVKNIIYDHWDIYLKAGDRLTFRYPLPPRRYEVALEEIC